MIDGLGRPHIYVGGASEWMKIPSPNMKLSKVSIGADGYILASEGNTSDIYCLSAKGNNFYKIDTSQQRDFSVGDANNVWAVSLKGFSHGYVDTYAQRIIITGDKGDRSQPLQIGEGKVAGEVGANVAANLVGVSRGGARVVALGNDRRLYTLTSNFRWKHISEIPPSYIAALSVNRNAFVVLDSVKGTITKYTPRAAAAAALPAGVAAAPPQSIQSSAALQQRIASTAAFFAASAPKAPAPPTAPPAVSPFSALMMGLPTQSFQSTSPLQSFQSTSPPSQATPTASGCADLVFRMNNLMKDYTALKDRFKDVDKTISGARVQTLLAGGGKRKKKYSVSRKLKARSSRKKRNSGKKSIKRR
jgi:hypothetical protein